MTPESSKRDPDSSSSSSAPSLAARLVEPPQMGAQPPKHVVDFAVEVSAWSPCRSKRGVVIFDGDDILTHGYNYKPGGFDCDGSDACKATCREEAVHAEQQALLARGPKVVRGSEMLHVKTVNGALVASGGPSCVQCSKLALVCGIAGVWLFHEDGWRRYPMVEFHHLSLAALQAGRLVDPSPPDLMGLPPCCCGHVAGNHRWGSGACWGATGKVPCDCVRYVAALVDPSPLQEKSHAGNAVVDRRIDSVRCGGDPVGGR